MRELTQRALLDEIKIINCIPADNGGFRGFRSSGENYLLWFSPDLEATVASIFELSADNDSRHPLQDLTITPKRLSPIGLIGAWRLEMA